MGNQNYFEQALANFTFETACGGSIRHLADHGYTVSQITGMLSYPASYEQVQNAVFDYFCSTWILLREEPEYDRTEERTDYVLEYDQYGKASFRRVTAKADRKKICSKESRFLSGYPEDFSRMLTEKISDNGESFSYISCDFGLLSGDQRAAALACLDSRQKEYIAGIPWKPVRMYHRLPPHMRDIAVRLYKNMHS